MPTEVVPPDPLCLSKVTVYVFAVQFATTVLFPVVLEFVLFLKSSGLEKFALAPGLIPVTTVPPIVQFLKV